MFWDASVPAFLLAVGMELLTTLIGEVAESWISRRDSTLRLCSYAPTDDVALEPHTDATFLTLQPIHSDQVGGLEGYWDNAWRPLNESGLLVYVGDFLEVITKGRYPALPHRIPFLRDARTSVVALLRGNNDAMIDTSGCPELASLTALSASCGSFSTFMGENGDGKINYGELDKIGEGSSRICRQIFLKICNESPQKYIEKNAQNKTLNKYTEVRKNTRIYSEI
eukprot:GEMP01034884.1.p1 GENE.GEMP01034884.1~~GEMP01034884.1.p1  ORF type:complete len:225 (+),score=34.82 GEMP01034884.1:295-969(+)